MNTDGIKQQLRLLSFQAQHRLVAPLSFPSLPRFMILGAQKCGSEFLDRSLAQHPRIKMARRAGQDHHGRGKLKLELHHFSNDEQYATGQRHYMSHFPVPMWKRESWQSGRSHLWGERTPNYLCKSGVPERVQAMLPNARFLLVLRNPVARTYSHYQMKIRKRRETRPFDHVVDELLEKYQPHQDELLRAVPGSLEKLGSECDPLARGLYAYHLEKWFRFYPRRRFHIIQSESMFENPAEVLPGAYAFLGVEHHHITHFFNSKARAYPAMRPHTRERLAEFYAPFNCALYNLTGVDHGWV